LLVVAPFFHDRPVEGTTQHHLSTGAHSMIRPILLACLTIATTLGLSAGTAHAANPTADQSRAMEARARAHISAFPGFTLHGNGHTYVVRDLMLDDDGAQHVRFDRSFNGMRVIGGDLVVHSDARSNFRSASLTLQRQINLPRNAAVSAVSALRAALAAFPGDPQGTRPELLVYARGDLPTLAWDVRVFGTQADGTPSELHVMVDGQTGAVLEAWDDVHTAPAAGTGQGFFNGTVALTTDLVGSTYSLRDPSRGNQYTIDMGNKQGGNGTIFTDANNLWGTGLLSSRQTVGVDATRTCTVAPASRATASVPTTGCTTGATTTMPTGRTAAPA
jgi:Zn-dependent metalloprotease